MTDQLLRRPSASTLSSIWQKSKRLASRKDSFAVRQCDGVQSQPPPLGTQPVHNSSTSSDEQYQRRREQVRRAQRNHRQKKEHYVRSLEQELVQLRADRVSLETRAFKAEAEVARLKCILSENSISSKAEVARKNDNPSEATVIINHKDPFANQQMFVSMPGFGSDSVYDSQLSGPGEVASSFSNHIPNDYLDRDRIDTINLDSYFEQPIQGPSSSELEPVVSLPGEKLMEDRSRNLFHKGWSIQYGINFILALENPCFGHARGPVGSPESSGHALTTQGILLGQVTRQTDSSDTSWQVPVFEIEKLLELSANLQLFQEVTPVQAWQRIQSHPNFEKCDRQTLDNMQSQLKNEVQCHGFGAVIDQVIFEHHLNKFLGPESS